MSTARQKEANRRNAQRSTGPRTEQGKAQSSRNALKHGLYSRDVVVDHPRVGEDPEQFAALQANLREELAPQAALEELLVERAAVHFWRLKRAARYEAARIRRQVWVATHRIEEGVRGGTHSEQEAVDAALGASLLPEKELQALLKYEAQQQQGLHRVLQELRDLKRDQVRRERAALDAQVLAKAREKAARDQALAEQVHSIVVRDPVAPWLLKEAAHHLRLHGLPAADAGSSGKFEAGQAAQTPGKGNGSRS